MLYDYIIVGAGISGLYSAHLLKKQNPDLKFKILESGDKSEIGGRARTEIFQNTPVSIGAGIGRKQKDKLLIQLLKELQVGYREFVADTNYASGLEGKYYIKEVFQMLKHQYIAMKKRAPPGQHNFRTTFREFALNLMSKSEYEMFRQCAGYTDYENEDVEDVLYNYGFEDNFTSWTGLGISWKSLIDALVKAVGPRHILTNSRVNKIGFIHKNDPDHEFTVYCKNGEKYQTKQLILATTIESVVQLLPNAKNKNSLYQQIHGQSFLRIYGQFDEPSREIVKNLVPKTTVVRGPLHKIIPMNAQEGIYMIAYTDNSAADEVRPVAKKKRILARMIEKALSCPEHSLNLMAIKEYYWKDGTHYYSPLTGPFVDRADFIRVAQRPYLGLFLVGEMVSLHQGWVEGALESTHAILNEFLTR